MATIARITQKARNREFIRRYKKMNGCSVCGYKKYHGAIHMHHLYPEEKKSSSTKAIQYMWSMVKIRAEIKKCVLLCANCHAEEHANGINTR